MPVDIIFESDNPENLRFSGEPSIHGGAAVPQTTPPQGVDDALAIFLASLDDEVAPSDEAMAAFFAPHDDENGEPDLPQEVRKSRAKETPDKLRAFQDTFFFDWASITIPNSVDGKGSKVPGVRGESESREAQFRLSMWSVAKGLHRQRVGKGSDGYQASLRLALDPTEGERVATIRAGHATNMPNLEIPGCSGMCARLAPQALAELGPVLLPRADVSRDISQEGLYDALFEYAVHQSEVTKMKPPTTRESEGRTFYFGTNDVTVKVYEKGYEQYSKGKIELEDVDPYLVRIEFTFRPQKGRKAGFARIARDQGPGALLGTSHWVRRMVEHLAEITDHGSGELGVTRVESTPDPKTAEDRAHHGARQYAKTFCEAAVARIVGDEHDGDWHAANISSERVEQEALQLVAKVLADTKAAQSVVTYRGVDKVRCGDEEAARIADDLLEWMQHQTEETERAQNQLVHTYDRMMSNPWGEKDRDETQGAPADQDAYDPETGEVRSEMEAL